eukprot:8574121-Karenia_brevis.AAC.1
MEILLMINHVLSTRLPSIKEDPDWTELASKFPKRAFQVQIPCMPFLRMKWRPRHQSRPIKIWILCKKIVMIPKSRILPQVILIRHVVAHHQWPLQWRSSNGPYQRAPRDTSTCVQGNKGGEGSKSGVGEGYGSLL